MSRNRIAGELMYKKALKDYGEEFIEKLENLCRNVRRDAGLQEDDDERWKTHGLIRDLGYIIQSNSKEYL